MIFEYIMLGLILAHQCMLNFDALFWQSQFWHFTLGSLSDMCVIFDFACKSYELCLN